MVVATLHNSHEAVRRLRRPWLQIGWESAHKRTRNAWCWGKPCVALTPSVWWGHLKPLAAWLGTSPLLAFESQRSANCCMVLNQMSPIWSLNRSFLMMYSRGCQFTCLKRAGQVLSMMDADQTKVWQQRNGETVNQGAHTSSEGGPTLSPRQSKLHRNQALGCQISWLGNIWPTC